MYEMRVEESDYGDLEKRNKRLKEIFHDCYDKINWMHENVNTLSANDAKLKKNRQNVS